MSLAIDLAEAAVGEVPKVSRERDPHTQGEHGGAAGARVALGLGEEVACDTVSAEVRVHGEAAKIESLALPYRQDAADQPAAGLGDDN